VRGSITIDVFSSTVTAPAAVAAGTEAPGDEDKIEPPKDGADVKVFTVLISVLIGKDTMLEI
jgi:hypothetical protein